MNYHNNHIILIGFKSVGKSVIGSELAIKLNTPFIDLDRKIEDNYENVFHLKKSCRQIAYIHGINFFRKLETLTLYQIINLRPSIISLGGGTPLNIENQKLIIGNMVVHITAPFGVVFERIKVAGRPAFFSEKEDLFETFSNCWVEREMIYKKLQIFSVNNNYTIDSAVHEIIKSLDYLSNKLQLRCHSGK